MSATNHTSNYELSQYIGSDEPKYLTDYNGDMSKIDVAIKNAETKADTANTGVATNASAISTLDSAVGSLQTQVTTVAGIANGNTGSINTINSLIGNGEPTTTDKTLIGAINELNAEIGSGTGGLETRVGALETSVGAIETEIGDTVLPTTAQTLTGAIAEIAQGGGSQFDFDITAHGGVMTVTSTAGTPAQYNTDVHCLLNAEKNIGKIYGGIEVNGTMTTTANSWNTIASLAHADMPTIQSDYSIITGFSSVLYTDSTIRFILTRLHFKTDGTIDVDVFTESALTVARFDVSLPPCIYFLKDLGD